MAGFNGNTPKWIAVLVSVAIACIGFAYGIGSNDVKTVETKYDSMCVRLRVVEADSATLKALIPELKEDIKDVKDDLREIKRLLGNR